uniref:Ribosomal protein L19 n=2 Tax=Ignatiaceae TaxID=2682551 RepID=A0A1W6EGW6_9CHLO|nr:ribosomal protein L19 [Pseudocharacium americanum]YP_009367737.1 ribosomal protein L19 [Ignatius tetrasporus]ARK14595.1 ribosomal protein L19 [Pseudocharacium americanum]ARK14684.1 ribosomal protein L19 [Ignatius tetrasporus]
MKLQQIVKNIEADYIKKDLPSVSIGDKVKVDVLIQESSKTRIQSYQGVVISQHRAGLNSTITVRRLSKGIGIERIFPIHSPDIHSIQIL